MADYFTAYRKRREAVHEYFEKLSTELLEMGVTIYKPKNNLITFIVLVKGNDQCTIEFQECPYCWEAYKNIVPSQGSGNCVRIVTRYKEFSAEEAYSLMRPYNGDIKSFHKKEATYLEKIEPEVVNQ